MKKNFVCVKKQVPINKNHLGGYILCKSEYEKCPKEDHILLSNGNKKKNEKKNKCDNCPEKFENIEFIVNCDKCTEIELHHHCKYCNIIYKKVKIHGHCATCHLCTKYVDHYHCPQCWGIVPKSFYTINKINYYQGQNCKYYCTAKDKVSYGYLAK